jgi:Raf kinase inhibitor-like YbhB/YbcL family protein
VSRASRRIGAIAARAAAPLAAALAAALAPGAGPAEEARAMPLRLESPRFADGAEIPQEYTCQGRDVSPPLRWSGAPAGTRSFALIVDDPDAPDPEHPRTTWVHWVVYDLPADASALAEAVTPAALPAGARAGLNDWKRTRYGGPCPPIGRHRYFHKLYALDAVLGDLGEPTRAALERAMEGHVLAKAELVGTYRKR